MKKFRVLAGALVTSAALALLTPTSGPAQAATCTMTPSSVTLYADAKNVKFDVPGTPAWQIVINELSAYPFENDEQSRAVWQLKGSWYRNSDAGKLKARVSKGHTGCDTTFQLLRGTRLKLKTKAIGGGKRSAQGTLERISFGMDDYEGYTAYRGQKVRIEFKSPSTGKWVKAGTVTTKKDGSFKLTKKIGKRQWRAVYAGSSTAGSRVSAVSKG